MRRPPLARTLLCTIVTGALAACAPAAPVTPSPTPYRCVADGVRTPGTCSRADYEAQQKEQQLFTEAQRVYRAFTDERIRIRHAGGVDTPTEVMLATTMDVYLSQMLLLFRTQKERGEVVTGNYLISNFVIERSQTKPDAQFVMRACEDGRQTSAEDRNGNPLPGGRIVNVVLYFKTEDETLKIFDWDGKAAESCLR